MSIKIYVEYDRDGEIVNAFAEKEHREIIRNYENLEVLTNDLNNSNLVDTGRWDGETSARLNKKYEINGYHCTSGGKLEIYESV